MHSLGIDIGYSNLKLAGRNGGGKAFTRTLPAGAALPDQLPRGVDGDPLKLGIEVLVNGQAWHAGVDPARLENWARELHPAYWRTPAYKALLHAGLVLADTETIDHLVTGLPVAQYQDRSVRAELQGICQRRHQVSRARQVTVRRATILPQPVGSWFHVMQTHPEGASMRGMRAVVLDPGYFSTDWVLFDGSDLKAASSGSSTEAMSRVLEMASRLIMGEHREAPPREMLEQAVRESRAHVHVHAREVKLAPYLEQATRQVAGRAIAAMRTALRAEGLSPDIVILAGGGARLFEPTARETYPDSRLIVVGEEVLANALGFGQFAHKLVAGESR